MAQSVSWGSRFQRSDPTLDAALEDLAFGAVEYDRERTLAAAAVIEERVGAGGLLDAEGGPAPLLAADLLREVRHRRCFKCQLL